MAEDTCQVNCIHEESVKKLRGMMIEEGEAQRLARIFKVLGDPTRIKIIQLLALEEVCVCDLANLINMSQSAVSHQLRLLRSERLVKYRRVGKIVFYSLDDDHVERLFAEGLEHIRHS